MSDLKVSNSKLISISGPPVAGKTTLLNALREDLGESCRFQNDFPREALESLGNEIADADPRAFQDFVGLTQLQREIASEKFQVPTLLDKCLLDALAYWRVLVGGPLPQWASFVQPRRYAMLVICEHSEIAAAGDELQQRHLNIRNQVAAELRQFSEGWPNVQMVSGSPQQRLEQVLTAMRRSNLLG